MFRTPGPNAYPSYKRLKHERGCLDLHTPHNKRGSSGDLAENKGPQGGGGGGDTYGNCKDGGGRANAWGGQEADYNFEWTCASGLACMVFPVQWDALVACEADSPKARTNSMKAVTLADWQHMTRAEKKFIPLAWAAVPIIRRAAHLITLS